MYALLTIIAFALCDVNNVRAAPIDLPQEIEVCTSEECITTANEILNKMNRTINPCQDFYKYACGQWIENLVIPEDKSSESSFNGVRDRVSLIIKRVLEEEDDSDRESVKKAKNYYKSCMDTETVDSLGGQPALDVIAEMGGMPLFGDPFDSSAFSLEDTLGDFIAKYQLTALVSMWVSTDSENSTRRLIHVNQPRLGLSNREYYLDEKRRKDTIPGYRQYMRDFLVKLWTEKDASTVDESAVELECDRIIQFETDLAGAEMSLAEQRADFEPMRNRTIAGMTSLISPDFDWSRFLNKIFAHIDVTLEDTRKIVSYGDRYFRNMTKILAKYDNELIQNYLVWIMLKSRTSYLSQGYIDTRVPYVQAVYGVSEEPPRWQICSRKVASTFEWPVGMLFVQDSFPEENKEVMETMMGNINSSFYEILETIDWMDKETKAAAEKKATMLSLKTAYPDFILNQSDPALDYIYKDIEILPERYFQNRLTVLFSFSKDFLRTLDLPVSRNAWGTGPQTVNAFYSPTRNQITLPAGILQPPFYNPARPNSMNYGAIGSVIGHELSHAFDDNGAEHNGIGNLEDWWSEESRHNFEQRSECFVKQYGGYYWDVAHSNLNGKLTLGENIADNGGIRQAYEAYQMWRRENNEKIRLPGLEEFTDDQLFFLSMAQVWCSKTRPQYASRLIAVDYHSPSAARVDVSLSNFEKFGEAYNCQRGEDFMYPNEEDTCRVW